MSGWYLRSRAKSRTRWLLSRWPLAEVLNRSRRTCWADLVSWAMFESDGDRERDAEYSLRGVFGEGERCRKESITHKDRACYCGKFTNGCLTQKGQTPGDIS